MPEEYVVGVVLCTLAVFMAVTIFIAFIIRPIFLRFYNRHRAYQHVPYVRARIEELIRLAKLGTHKTYANIYDAGYTYNGVSVIERWLADEFIEKGYDVFYKGWNGEWTFSWDNWPEARYNKDCLFVPAKEPKTKDNWTEEDVWINYAEELRNNSFLTCCYKVWNLLKRI